MTGGAEFVLLPLSTLKGHERIDEANLLELIAHLRRSQMLSDPIWVARASLVILNGHHRVEALRRLGAERVPAWLLDYESELIHLERWHSGPPIAKSEVLRRAEEGRPFPPKTTRHRLLFDLPARPTRLSELLPGPVARRRSPAHPRASVRS
jgi:L-serine kinase (ADP)